MEKQTCIKLEMSEAAKIGKYAENIGILPESVNREYLSVFLFQHLMGPFLFLYLLLTPNLNSRMKRVESIFGIFW